MSADVINNSSACAPLNELLWDTIKLRGSDLHLTLDSLPIVRVDGELTKLPRQKLCKECLNEHLMPILTDRQKVVLAEQLSVDTAYKLDEEHRFRVNIFYQRGALAAVFRQLPHIKLSLEALGIPEGVNYFSDLKDGLVLVTGPTGSGKSTTLAAIIDEINKRKACHIITIEDPVEFVHTNNKALITQRELFTDVPSFSGALRDAMREDPDVILVGEMRDLDTMRTAIMAAETGHLVFSTLHSRDAESTLARMIGVFPIEEQSQIRQQLSSTLKGVVSQRLLRRSGESGRVAAVEVMRVTPAISNIIRTNKLEQMYSTIETGGKFGMQTMELSLVKLFREGLIDRETATRMAKSESVIKSRLDAVDA